jgi:hypothetical protein
MTDKTKMKLKTEQYETQQQSWPQEGQHILAHYDETSIIVYQAYRHSMGKYAAEHGRFGGPDFSFSRMSWIKPNFLWMMYRSGWGTKEGQEVTLALRLRREFFDQIMEQAVLSSYDTTYPGSRDEWADAVSKSDVRLQWDPDHSPTGAKLARRAVQHGLRGKTLEAFAGPELLEVIDISDFVESQRTNATEPENGDLWTPAERIYVPRNSKV